MAVVGGEQSSAREQSVCSPFLTLPPPGLSSFLGDACQDQCRRGDKPLPCKKACLMSHEEKICTCQGCKVGKKEKKKKKNVILWILRAVTTPAASHQSHENRFQPQDVAVHCQARPGTLAALQPRTRKRRDPSF